MSRRPHDLEEWLQFLRLSKDTRIAEFAVELQDLLEDDCTPEYWELREDLERIADRKFPGEDFRIVEFFEVKLNAADERYTKLLERAERICALEKPLEYDL